MDADFDEGTSINVVHDPSDQLQLDDTTEAFGFIWIAVSSKGTIVKIDTETGDVVGEYKSAPDGRGTNPSRTTVDNNGSVWATNRSESGSVPADGISPGVPSAGRSMGSVLQIGLEENGECVDRNGNGVIDTSTGFADIRSWSNAGNVDDLGGVSTADDECILQFVRVNSTGTRHVSVNADNDVWVSGTGGKFFDLIDGDTGNIIRQEPSVGYGGYGGLIDGNGVIWSARPLLRWDTVLPLTGGNGTNWTGYAHDSYGLCIDSLGNVWNTSLNGNEIRKFDPSGSLIGTFSHGNTNAQGCVVDANDHVWVAHSLLGSNTVGHLLSDGTYIGNVTVGSGPTGVAVDAAGKVWATNVYDQTASRIDPNAGPIGADGATLVGDVDFTTGDLGGQPYNYSDMTGSTLIGAPENGTWSIVHDTGIANVDWGNVSWNAFQPDDSNIVVTVSSSTDGLTFGATEAAVNGAGLAVANGQYLKVSVGFSRSNSDADMDGINDSPILFDLTIAAITNQPPNCSAAAPDVALLWPPNHKFRAIEIGGVTDPDGDIVSVTIDTIRQDEPVLESSTGNTAPDGRGVGTAVAEVRAERAGSKKVPGDGRFYHIGFTADDGNGESCTGEVRVVVPHDRGNNSVSVDGGPVYDSTVM